MNEGQCQDVGFCFSGSASYRGESSFWTERLARWRWERSSHVCQAHPSPALVRASVLQVMVSRGKQYSEMVTQHRRLNGHICENSADSEGQGSLLRCSPRGRRGSDTTERLSDTTALTVRQLVGPQRFPVTGRLLCVCKTGVSR